MMMNASNIDSGCLNLSGFRSDELSMMQIHSPSRLYSVLIPKEATSSLCLKELFFLNNATKTVKKYAIKPSQHGGENSKVNYLYWLADFLLVGVTQGDRQLTQTIFTIDHVANIIVKDRERSFEVTPNTLSPVLQNRFGTHFPVTTIDEKKYIVWPGSNVFDDEHFCMFFIPKNPLASGTNIKQFLAESALRPEIRNEIDRFLGPGASETISIDFPAFSHGSQLLCRIGFLDQRHIPVLELAGVYVAYDVDKLVDVYGKDDLDLFELDYVQESASSLTVIPRPSTTAREDLYTLTNFIASSRDNQYLMVNDYPLEEMIEIRLINFDTMEFKCKIIPRERFTRLSLQPDGIVLLWNQTADKIEYKKVIFNWKSDSLLDISRKSLFLSGTINSTVIDGLQPILFPGSDISLICK